MASVEGEVTTILSYGVVFMVLFSGVFVNWLHKEHSGRTWKELMKEFATDFLTSGFVMFISYAYCKSRDFDEWMTIGIVGIASHMGTRALMVAESIISGGRFSNKSQPTGEG